jgi:hypothetical protein
MRRSASTKTYPSFAKRSENGPSKYEFIKHHPVLPFNGNTLKTVNPARGGFSGGDPSWMGVLSKISLTAKR